MHYEDPIKSEGAQSAVLRIYASSSDRMNGKILFEDIVLRARDEGISGVTVYRGVMGFGLSTHIHTSKFWELTEKLPIVIEAVDEAEKLTAFFGQIEADLKESAKGCLVTMDPVQVLLHQKGCR